MTIKLTWYFHIILEVSLKTLAIVEFLKISLYKVASISKIRDRIKLFTQNLTKFQILAIDRAGWMEKARDNSKFCQIFGQSAYMTSLFSLWCNFNNLKNLATHFLRASGAQKFSDHFSFSSKDPSEKIWLSYNFQYFHK